ncbi:hypothetical protein B9Z55_008067 [Caenorhabditis nigoni]|uniref:Uncharacterized protein n=1 Tax=Caenorhabditis nigoni TaxID=1611254 RepID=A0A2G5VCK3_9PELO|nr:hypothetical protein B9Z55_008067 [Caenorhabditis nigoni]
MGSSNSKAPPQPEYLHVTIFGNYETLMKSVNKIGPLVEKSESGPAKMCWIQLKTETEKQLRDKRALEEEREQILKEEEEENGKILYSPWTSRNSNFWVTRQLYAQFLASCVLKFRETGYFNGWKFQEAAEKLRVVLTELELNALMSLIDKCSLRIQCHILKVGASHQCFLKLQDDFGFIQTVVTNEMIKKIKAKVESLDWEELAELEKILDPTPGTTVTVTDANGTLISEQIQLDGIQETISLEIEKPDS